MLTALLACCLAVPDDRPNIIVIVADDLGYGSLGIYGEKEIPTPNIDSIAKNGARLTDGYVTCPVCSPTRAGLMTGRYQQRFGHEFNPGPQQSASSKFGLDKNETTMPQELAKAGYRTGMVGKWHLGYADGLMPTDRGFGSFYGFLGGAHGYTVRQNTGGIYRDKKEEKPGEYLTDAFAREAVSFIEKKSSSPYFLYLAFNAVHSPLQAPPKYTNLFDKLDDKRKTFAAMEAALDTAVGRVLQTVRKKGEEEKTLIIFISDNGGPTPQTTSRNDPLRGYKGQVLEGGIRVPFMVQWKGKVAPGKLINQPVISLDIFPTVLEAAKVPGQKKTLEGRSLMPTLGGLKDTNRAMFWRFGEQWAVRQGDWKLLSRGGAEELYNLKSDIGESKNLAAENPTKAAELKKLYDAWNKDNVPAKWKRGEDGD